MLKTLAVLVSLAALVGCSPACGDSTMEGNSIHACENTGGSASYCTCAMEHIYGKYSCDDIGKANVPTSAVIDACRACGGNC